MPFSNIMRAIRYDFFVDAVVEPRRTIQASAKTKAVITKQIYVYVVCSVRCQENLPQTEGAN